MVLLFAGHVIFATKCARKPKDKMKALGGYAYKAIEERMERDKNGKMSADVTGGNVVK